MEIVVSILTGALVTTALGAALAPLDRGTLLNAVIGALGGGVLGGLLTIRALDGLKAVASENEIFTFYLILGAIGATIAALVVNRVMAVFSD